MLALLGPSSSARASMGKRWVVRRVLGGGGVGAEASKKDASEGALVYSARDAELDRTRPTRGSAV